MERKYIEPRTCYKTVNDETYDLSRITVINQFKMLVNQYKRFFKSVMQTVWQQANDI